MIDKKTVKVIKVDYLCDTCFNPLKLTVTKINSLGAIYYHTCTECRCDYFLDAEYPHFEYIDIGETAT